MSDYAIYGKCNKEDVRLMIIDESTWSMEKDISPIPLTEPTNLYEENEYWVECTTGKKLVFIKDEVDEITAKGDVSAVLYWSAALNTSFWENDTDTFSNNYELGINWSWNGTKWSATNSTGAPALVFLKAVGSWTTDYRPGFFKVALEYSGTPPTSSIGGFCSGKVASYGGLTSTFGTNALTRSKSGLSNIIGTGYNIERFGIVIPAGQTVSITGLWFSSQIWLPDFNTWVTHLDPTKWSDGGSASIDWIEDSWVVSGTCSATFTAIGTWNDVGRPSAIRIDFDYTDMDLIDVTLTDSQSNVVCDVDGVVPGQIMLINTQGNDIETLSITMRGTSDCTGKTLAINSIQFYYGTNAIAWGGYDNVDAAIKNAYNTSGTDDGATYIRDMNFYGFTANITSGKELTFYSDTSTQFTASLYNMSTRYLEVGPITSSGVDSLQEVKFTDTGNFYAVIQNSVPSDGWKDIFSFTLVTPVGDGGEGEGGEACPGYVDATTAMANIEAFEVGTANYGEELPVYLDIEADKFLAVNFSTIEAIEQYDLSYSVTSTNPFTVYYYEGTEGDLSVRQTMVGDFDGVDYVVSWGSSEITTILGNTHLYTVIKNTGEACGNFRVHTNWIVSQGGEGGEGESLQSFDGVNDAIYWADENMTHNGYNDGYIHGGEGGEEGSSTISVAGGKYGAIKYYNVRDDYLGNGSTISMVGGESGDDVHAYTFYWDGGEGEPSIVEAEVIGGEGAGPFVGGEGVNFYHYDPCYIVIYNPTGSDFNYEIYFIAGNGNV